MARTRIERRDRYKKKSIDLRETAAQVADWHLRLDLMNNNNNFGSETVLPFCAGHTGTGPVTSACATAARGCVEGSWPVPRKTARSGGGLLTQRRRVHGVAAVVHKV